MTSRFAVFALLGSTLSVGCTFEHEHKDQHDIGPVRDGGGGADGGASDGGGGDRGERDGGTDDGGRVEPSSDGGVTDGGPGFVDAGASEDSGSPPADAGDAATVTPLARDSDGDGFRDQDDPAPDDAAVPGNFSTPESILADPRVKAALDAARAAGLVIATHTEKDVPDIAGLFRTEESAGHFVATGNGENVGGGMVGSEARVDQHADFTVDKASVVFSRNTAIGYTISAGNLLRGKSGQITIYSRAKSVCTIDGADFTTFAVSVASADVDPVTHDWKNLSSMAVTVATRGTLTDACAKNFAGDAEIIGGWSAYEVPLVTAVTSLDLEYLCIEGENGFAPTETWTGANGDRCECTATYGVACSEP